MKLKTFTVNVRVNAIVSYPIQAESLEAALEKARQDKETVAFTDGIDYIDGHEEIIGVDGLWDLQ